MALVVFTDPGQVGIEVQVKPSSFQVTQQQVLHHQN